MKQLIKSKALRFTALLLVLFYALNAGVAHWMRSYVIESGRFVYNDFEVVRRDHPEKVWDKVFFGNSVVISAYREEESQSGYLNLGLDYGVVTDLWDMIRHKDMQIGSELVIGLNDLTMYDDFETNPGYPWHQKWYMPYCYFERDRLNTLIEETVKQYLLGEQPKLDAYSTMERPYYYSSLSQAQLEQKAADSKYIGLPLSDFSENFRALESIFDYCAKKNIRVRVVWMPYNPSYEAPQSTVDVREQTRAICEASGVEFHDMSDALEAACFYDFGHLNYEYGSHVFTKEIEPWLAS